MAKYCNQIAELPLKKKHEHKWQTFLGQKARLTYKYMQPRVGK